jgi:uncharacterized protein YjbJ (UPF0337 family)
VVEQDDATPEVSMNKHQVKGWIEVMGGRLKEVTGRLVGNKSLEEKGKLQKTIGQTQAVFGDVREEFKKSD